MREEIERIIDDLETRKDQIKGSKNELGEREEFFQAGAIEGLNYASRQLESLL